MATDYNYWRSLVKQVVSSVADEGYQRREWIENQQTTYFTPVEFFCKFFDDADIERFLEKNNENGLSQDQNKLLAKLYNEMEVLSDKFPEPDEVEPEILLDDPQLVKCRQIAKEFLSMYIDA